MSKQEAVGMLVLGIMVGAAAMILFQQYASDVFRKPKHLPDLDWVRGLEEGLVSLDTATVWRRASALVSRERRGESTAALLRELDALEDALADVGARLLTTQENEQDAGAIVEERIQRYSNNPVAIDRPKVVAS